MDLKNNCRRRTRVQRGRVARPYAVQWDMRGEASSLVLDLADHGGEVHDHRRCTGNARDSCYHYTSTRGFSQLTGMMGSW